MRKGPILDFHVFAMTHQTYAKMLLFALFITGFPEIVISQSVASTTDTVTVPSTTYLTVLNNATSDVVTVVKSTPRPPDDIWVVHDKSSAVCILIGAEPDVKFDIFHSGNSKRLESQPNMNSDDVGVSGKCEPQNSTWEITLSWSSYRFTFVFTQLRNGKLWAVKKFVLQFNPQDVFKDKSLPESAVVSSADDLGYLTTPLNMSNSCKDPPKVQLAGKNSNATVVFSGLKAQAFVGADGTFGPEFVCGSSLGDLQEDTVGPVPIQKSDTVPIAVGSTMAVLTLLVIIGYAVYRSFTFKKVDYDTMG